MADRRDRRRRFAGGVAGSTEIAPAKWCDDAADALLEASRGDLDIIAAEVKAGVSNLWRISGASAGWMVTREEPGELVIVAASGVNALPIMAFVTEKAISAGLSVRVHLVRPGLIRMYKSIGFEQAEIVMRIRPDGQ